MRIGQPYLSVILAGRLEYHKVAIFFLKTVEQAIANRRVAGDGCAGGLPVKVVRGLGATTARAAILLSGVFGHIFWEESSELARRRL